MIFRSDNRAPDQIRPVNIVPDFISTAEGSALIEIGNTRHLHGVGGRNGALLPAQLRQRLGVGRIWNAPSCNSNADSQGIKQRTPERALTGNSKTHRSVPSRGHGSRQSLANELFGLIATSFRQTVEREQHPSPGLRGAGSGTGTTGRGRNTQRFPLGASARIGGGIGDADPARFQFRRRCARRST